MSSIELDLTAWRREQNLSAADAARLLRVSRSTWDRWEAGKGRPSNLKERLLEVRTGARIAPAPPDIDRADRIDAALLALAPELARVLDLALAAGWTKREVLHAMAGWAAGEALERGAEAAVDTIAAALREAIRRK